MPKIIVLHNLDVAERLFMELKSTCIVKWSSSISKFKKYILQEWEKWSWFSSENRILWAKCYDAVIEWNILTINLGMNAIHTIGFTVTSSASDLGEWDKFEFYESTCRWRMHGYQNLVTDGLVHGVFTSK